MNYPLVRIILSVRITICGSKHTYTHTLVYTNCLDLAVIQHK